MNTKIDDVVEHIKLQIESGIYSSGQKLPSERNMADELKVSRSTIRNAFIRLQSENVIDIVPRGGVFVRSHTPRVTMGDTQMNKGPELKLSGSFIHLMRKEGRNVVVRYLEPSSVIKAGHKIGKMLDVNENTKVLKRNRVQSIDRVPYRILDSYYLGSLTSELEGEEDHKIPLFKWLYDNKKFLSTRTIEKLISRMPTAEEATILNIGRNQPVIEMHRWIKGKYENKDEEITFEYSQIICNASLHEFQYEYEIEKAALK